MSLGDRMGILGAILALTALAVTILWPDKKWIGWIALGFAMVLLLGWGWVEIGSELPRLRSRYPIISTITIFIIGGCLAAALWRLVPLATGQIQKTQPPNEVASDKSDNIIPPVKQPAHLRFFREIITGRTAKQEHLAPKLQFSFWPVDPKNPEAY